MNGHSQISPQAFPYPMPMTIVSAVVDGKVNHMAVAWVTRVNFQPPLIGIALGKSHRTNRGIHRHGQFAVNVPPVGLLAAVDYAGLVSSARMDKSALFEVFTGALEHAPLVAECPLNLACRLVQAVDLPTNEFFIGEIVEAYCAEEAMSDGRPDIGKLRPFTLTMPDNRYWAVGQELGAAWSIGRQFQP